MDPDKKKFSFLEILTPLFCVLLVTSNIVASKFFDFRIFGLNASLDIGTLLLFPMLYIFGDILAEVWGYAASRRVIWTGFAMQILSAIIFAAAVAMPFSEFFDGQQAFVRVLGAVPALVVASLAGYWAGSFTNSFVMVKMKEWMVNWDPDHKFLPLRTISSTIVGEFADTAIFVGIASIFGIFPTSLFLTLTITQWIVKTLIEAIMTPVTVVVVKNLKAYEQVDMVGIEAGDSYSPFAAIKQSSAYQRIYGYISYLRNRNKRAK